jgi:imidazole glycerol phosphate synthase subunit HisF
MSFQAYLDTAERRTGRTPQQLVDEAHARGFGAETRAGEILSWLADEHGLGRGHGMALVHVVRNGPTIGVTHVGSGGAHADASTELRLDGLDRR